MRQTRVASKDTMVMEAGGLPDGSPLFYDNRQVRRSISIACQLV